MNVTHRYDASCAKKELAMKTMHMKALEKGSIKTQDNSSHFLVGGLEKRRKKNKMRKGQFLSEVHLSN